MLGIGIGTGIGMRNHPAISFLTNSGQGVGGNLAAANASLGERGSMLTGRPDVAANTIDYLNQNGFTRVGVSKDVINLVDTDLTVWTPFRFTTPDANTMMEDNTTNTRLVRHTFASTDPVTATCEISPIGKTRVRLDLDGTSYVDFLLTGSGTVVSEVGTTGTIKLMSNGRYQISITRSSSASTILQVIGLSDAGATTYAGDTAKGYNIYNIRAADSSAPVPAAVAGTGAGEAWAADVVSFTFPAAAAATGWAATYLQPYGWSNTGNPADAQPIFLEAGALSISLDASGFYTTNGGAVSTKKPVDGVSSSIIVTWDGVNHTISVDGETPVSNASAIVPSGTGYLGNESGGAKAAHAIETMFIFAGVPIQGTRDTWNNANVNVETK